MTRPLGDLLSGTPPFNHVDTVACRRSYGRRASGDAVPGVNASALAVCQTLP